MIWIKHPRNKKPDTMLTFSVLALIVVLIKVALSGVTFYNINFGSIDAAIIAALLTPTLAAYVGRKYKDSPDEKNDN